MPRVFRISNYGLLPKEGRSGRAFLDGSMIHVSIKLKSAPITSLSKKLMMVRLFVSVAFDHDYSTGGPVTDHHDIRGDQRVYG
jgi:hypothetical protein